MVSKFSKHENPLEGLLNHGVLSILASVSDSVDRGQGLILCISNKLSGSADAAGTV